MNQLQGALTGGLDDLSGSQQVTFTQYTRNVFSQDGYVFWVANGTTMVSTGSLHIGTQLNQDEDETMGLNSLVFTSEREVSPLNGINPSALWIGAFTAPGGETLDVAFSARGPFYQRADLYHYTGFAVYPALKSQIVQSASDLPTGPIVSNSLPFWLSSTGTPVYPSFLVPDNIVPPYIVCHIEPELTTPIQPVPYYEWPGNPATLTDLQPMPVHQLARDHVRLVMYGLTNLQAQQYYASLVDDSLSSENYGFVGEAGVIRDEKRGQAEIQAIAMKKTLEFDVSYYQAAADAIARRLILEAGFASITIS